MKDNCAIFGRYAVGSDNFLPTFRDHQSVPLWRVKNQNPLGFSTPENWGRQFVPETSVRYCHHSLRNDPEEHSSQLHRGGSLKSRTRIFKLRKESVAHAQFCLNLCLNLQCNKFSGASWLSPDTSQLWPTSQSYRCDVIRLASERLVL